MPDRLTKEADVEQWFGQFQETLNKILAKGEEGIEEAKSWVSKNWENIRGYGEEYVSKLKEYLQMISPPETAQTLLSVTASLEKEANAGYPNDVDKCRDCVYFNSGIGTVYYKCSSCVHAYNEKDLKGMSKEDKEEIVDMFSDRGTQQTVQQPKHEQKHASLKKKSDLNDAIMYGEQFIDIINSSSMEDWKKKDVVDTVYAGIGWLDEEAGEVEGAVEASKKAAGMTGDSDDMYKLLEAIKTISDALLQDYPSHPMLSQLEMLESTIKHGSKRFEQIAQEASNKTAVKRNDAIIQAFFDKAVRNTASRHLYYETDNNGEVLINYSTPILFRSAKGQVYFNTDKYSRTTSALQSKMRYMADVEMEEVDEARMKQAIAGELEDPDVIDLTDVNIQEIESQASILPIAKKETIEKTASANAFPLRKTAQASTSQSYYEFKHNGKNVTFTSGELAMNGGKIKVEGKWITPKGYRPASRSKMIKKDA